jgi:hypothetical protein
MRKCCLWIVPVLLTVLPYGAFAQKPDNKPATGKREASFKEDKSLEISKEEAIAKAKKEQEKGVGTIKYEDFVGTQKKMQDLKLPILQQQEGQLRRQLQIMRSDDKRRVEYLFRLADIFVQYEQIYKFRFGESVELLGNAKTAADKAKYEKEKANNMRLQKKYLEDALKELNAITTNKAFADWARMDEVLFKLGDIARELGYQDIMQEKFRTLLRNYPNSNFVPKVHLAFAEFYFKQGRNGLKLATDYYMKVVNNPKVKEGDNIHIYFYARRMLGWCYFNLQDFPKAQSEFLFVAQNAKQETLKKQTRREVVMAYSMRGNKEQAFNFFTHQLGAEYSRDLYLMLANEYFTQGNMANMIWVFDDLIKRFPQDAQRCEWLQQIYQGYKLDNILDKMEDSLKKLVLTMTEMKKQFGDKKMETMVCTDFAKRNLYDQAKRSYIKYDKAKGKASDETEKLLNYSASLYKEFLEYFPTDDDVYDMRYDYAQLLGDRAYNLEKNSKNEQEIREAFRVAAREFSVLLKVEKAPKDMTPQMFEKNREDIGNNTVALYFRVLGVDFAKEEKQRDKKADDYLKRRNCLNAKQKTEAAGKKFTQKCPAFEKNLPIPQDLKDVIDVFNLYVKYVKAGKNLAIIKYNRAMIYYMYRNFNDAIPLFADTIRTSYQLDPQMSLEAALYLMIAYDAEDRFEDMVDMITELLKPTYNPMFNISPDAKKFRARLEAKKLENMEMEVAKRGEEGRYREAGDMLTAMAREFKSDAAKVIQYYTSASIAFEKAGMIGLAIGSLRELQSNYGSGATKDQPQVVNSYIRLGQLFEQIAMFDAAASAYENFFGRYPKDPDAVRAARRAVQLTWWSGDLKGAERKAMDFIEKLYKMGAAQFKGDVSYLYFMLHQFHEDRKTKDGQSAGTGMTQHFLGKYIEIMGRNKVEDLTIRVLAKQGKILWDQSCPVPTRYGICMSIVYVERKSKTDTWKVATVRFEKRDRGKVRAASEKFTEAINVYNRWKGTQTIHGALDGTDKTNRINEALDAVALAKFHLAEASYEEVISMELPEFTIKTKKDQEKSIKDIMKWIETQTKLMEKNKKLYEEAASLMLGKRVNSWYIPAAGRFGAIFKNFVTKLKNMKFGKEIEANIEVKLEIQDMFSKSYEKMEELAKAGFEDCVKKAQKSGRYDEWFEFCENELAEIRRSVSPVSDEVWGSPDFKDTKISRSTVAPVPVR